MGISIFTEEFRARHTYGHGRDGLFSKVSDSCLVASDSYGMTLDRREYE